jgi:hypothetical protein
MPSILLLGDSHTHGSYGKALEKLFKAAGWRVTRVGWVSARADHYLTGGWKKLTLGGTGDWDAAKGKHYDVAVVSLATNDAANIPTNGKADAAAGKIVELIDTIDADTIWWVGPPAFDPSIARTYNKAFKDDDLNARADRLWTAASSKVSRAIDPRKATQPFVSSSDIHFDGTGAPKGGGKAWAQLVFDTVSSPGSSLSTSGSSPGAGLVLALAGLGLVAWWWFKKRRA